MKETKKEINLFLFQPDEGENFGEYLCKMVIKEMGFNLNNYSTTNPIPKQLDHVLTGIGPFFNEELYRAHLKGKFKKWYVWGTGVHCIVRPNFGSRLPADVINQCVITLLRGPLTKEYSGIKEDVLLGDPGYLASYFFKFPEEEKKNVLITHHHDTVKKEMKDIDIELSCLMKEEENSSFDDKALTILKSISNANIVLTSSMHIAIVAYTYGVPFAMVSKVERDLSKEWKWHDTLQNMGITKEIKLCNSVEEGYAWWNSVKDEIKPFTVEYQEKILATFPFKKE